MYTVSIKIDVLEPARVLQAARNYAEECGADPNEIDCVADALPWFIEASVTAVDCGFEIIDKTCVEG